MRGNSSYGEFVPGMGLQQQGPVGYGAYDPYAAQYGAAAVEEHYGDPYADQYGAAPVEEMPAPVEGVWAMQTCCAYEAARVSCLEYDDFYERLWVGHSSGRVTSLMFVEDPVTGMVTGDRYSSFMATKDGGVVKVIPQGQFVLSLNQSCIKMHTDGGLPMGNINAPESIDAGTATFTCGVLCHRGRGQQGQPVPHLLAGTSHTYALLYDLQSLSSSPVLTYDVTVASCCMVLSGQHVVVAGQDGKLRLLDGRLRSSGVLHTLDAHSGTVHDVAVSPDGQTMITCGAVGRPNSQYASPRVPNDPLIKIFDLRTNRQLPPMTMTTSSPHVLKFLTPPELSGVPPNPYNHSTRLLMGSSSGLLQISDPSPAADPSHTQILYAPFSGQRESLSAGATASSGHLIAVGTSLGTVAQFAVGLQTPADKPKVNTAPSVLQAPPSIPPPPMLSLGADAPVLGTAYCVNPRPVPADQYEEPLASAFATTPKFLTRNLRLGSARKISTDLLRNLSAKDFIGIVPNPGFPLNGLLHAPPVAGKRAYALSDPRRLDGVDQQSPRGDSAGGTAGQLQLSTREQQGAQQSEEMAVNPAIPMTYRRQQSHRGKQRILSFNYAACNATLFVGLENSMPNAYTNPVLQLMGFLPEMVVVASAAQTSHYHHHSPTSLWIELGFLFHMMRLVERAGGEKGADKVVTPGNFQRTFQQVPEAVALGLFDGSQTNPQILVQIFIRFMLQQLHRESELETRPPSEARSVRAVGGPSQVARFYSAVDEIFGHTILSHTTFLQSNTTETGAPIRAFALDLVYPAPKVVAGIKSTSAAAAAAAAAAASTETAALAPTQGASTVPNRPPSKPISTPLTFATIMWLSLRRETSMRGWCNASRSNEPFKQVRSMVSLPRVMALLCGDTLRDPKDATVSGALGEATLLGSMHSTYWSTQSHLGGPWLPIELEVALMEGDAASGQQSKLVVSALMLPPAAPTTTDDASSAVKTEDKVENEGEDKSEGKVEDEAAASAQAQGQSQSQSQSQSQALLRWVIFDGSREFFSAEPASRLPQFDMAPPRAPHPPAYLPAGGASAGAPARVAGWEVVNFRLAAAISEVLSSVAAISPREGGAQDQSPRDQPGDRHVLLHLRECPHNSNPMDLFSPMPVPVGGSSSASAGSDGSKDWLLFNDFALTPTDALDAVSFPAWKHPCAIFFARSDYQYSFPHKARAAAAAATASASAVFTSGTAPSMFPTSAENSTVPSSVLQLPSLSSLPSVRLNATTLPGKGALVAFDGEFVSVELERAVVNATGHRVVSDEGRQVLARISLVEGGAVGEAAAATATMRVLVDDYIVPSEAVLDYVTRFSGIVAEDLQPAVSRHPVVTNRTAYLKLRFFVDRGCCFVGHGLQKDFETANVVVPREQVIDTVELWRLPGQRKISLRFLAAYLLHMDIQDEIHDSIEDAKTALALYRHYEQVSALGPAALNAVLQDLYNYGQRNNWVLGSDQIGR